MPQILLVNPSPPPSKQIRRAIVRPDGSRVTAAESKAVFAHVKSINRKEAKMATAKKKRRTPAQIAATAKLARLNKAKRAAPKRPPRAAPKKRAVARPARAPKRRGHRISSSRAASQAGRVLRYRRPNPMSFVTDTLLPSAVGGAGALALDILVAVLPLPPMLKVGPAAPLVKIAGAVGLGMLASAALGRKTGEQIAAGALTVTIYNFSKAALVKLGGGKIPGLAVYPEGPLGEFVSGDDMIALGYAGSGMDVGAAMGEHVSGDGYDMAGYETGVYR